MLTELVVERLGVIARATIELGPGSSALTGETGAGKTLVVAATALLLGARADAGLIRTGAEDARVEGHFLVPSNHPAVLLAAERGLLEGNPREDEVELVIARDIASDAKRNRARINGRLVPLGVSSEISSHLLEVAGQNEHGRVAVPSLQRAALDSYSGVEELVVELGVTVRAARRAAERAQELRAAERDRARELDTARYEVAEIERAGVVVGETDRLLSDVRRLEHAEEIRGALTSASTGLKGEGGAIDALANAGLALERIAAKDGRAGRLIERLNAARLEVEDIALELRDEPGEATSSSIEQIRSRIDQLAALKRRYGPDEDAILEYLAGARARIQALDGAEEEASHLEEEAARHDRAASEMALRLTQMRRQGAARLQEAVVRRLARLALPDARFVVDLQPGPVTETGAESVSFLLSTNAGEDPKPLGKVASGGELSRVALALHLTCFSAHGATLIFDEVDAGVGGEAATEVGRSLAELAAERSSQVVVITHLPQVAAFASDHFVVQKRSVGGRSETEVGRIEGDERVLELSRMLAGLPGSERAQDHARELLSLAGTGGP